jgi:hypothetical protein
MAVIKAKRRRQQSIGYDGMICIPFPTVVSAPNLSINTTLQAIPLFMSIKVIGVSLYLGSHIGGNCYFQVVYSASNGPYTIPALDTGNYPVPMAVNGDCLFNSPQVMNSNFTGFQYWDTTTPAQGGVCNPPQTVPTYDAIWGKGTRLTIRLQTDGTTVAGNCNFFLWCKIVDPNPTEPEQSARNFYPSYSQI